MVSMGDEIRAVSPAARLVRAHGHDLGVGRTPTGKPFAQCSCGWRGQWRSKFTHVTGDARTHVGQVAKQLRAEGAAEVPAEGPVYLDERRARAEGRAPRVAGG